MPVSTIENLSGRTFGNIEIGDIAGSNPRKYHLSCKRCRSQWVSTHTKIKNELQTSAGLTCANTGCTLPIADQMKREAQFFREMKEKERADGEAFEEARLRANYGFSAPTPPAPKPSLEAIEAEYMKNASELARAERERIVKGLPDPDFVPDPRYDKARMPNNEASEFNESQSRIFMETCPDYYPSPENSNVMLNYLSGQGVNIISAETFQRAYDRLNQFNLFEPWPEPEPAPEHHDPDHLPSMHEGYYEPKLKPQQMWEGIDLDTGENRIYSDYEIRRMTSDELRRKLRIPTAPMVRRDRAA